MIEVGSKFIITITSNTRLSSNSLDQMMRKLNRNESSRVYEVPFSSEAIKDAIENAVALEERCDCALRGSQNSAMASKSIYSYLNPSSHPLLSPNKS